MVLEGQGAELEKREREREQKGMLTAWLVNEKAYRLSFCEDPFLCAIISIKIEYRTNIEYYY